MRRLATFLNTLLTLYTGLSAFLSGLAMTLPSVWSGMQVLNRSGIAFNEFPWIPASVGLIAVLRGRRGGFWAQVGAWLGFIGAVLAVRPLWHVARTVRAHDQAMKAGLGSDFETLIPTPLKADMISTRLGFAQTAIRWGGIASRIQITYDVTYRVTATHQLKADFYQPRHTTEKAPAIVVIHGGSWDKGSKGEIFQSQCKWLAAQGYVVMDIDYRLAPQFTYKAQVEDVHGAIHWLRTHADSYGIDPGRIGLLGRSAGGHLALMAAFTASTAESVAAVVALYPPTDMPLLQSDVFDSLENVIGGSIEERPDLYVQASPLYVLRDPQHPIPPVLMGHGGWDNLVTPEHSRRLAGRLTQLEVPNVYLYYPWGRHGFDFAIGGLGGHMFQYDTDRFLAWALRQKGNPS
jgi:acetyl esterase/lipase